MAGPWGPPTTSRGDGHGLTVVMLCFPTCYPPLKNHGPNRKALFTSNWRNSHRRATAIDRKKKMHMTILAIGAKVPLKSKPSTYWPH